MNKKITLYTLNGCGYCEKLKNNLIDLNIEYRVVECTQDNKQCNELESITGCDAYPMAIIEKNPFERIILCITNEYDKLHDIKTIDRKTIQINVHSINNILTVINNV